MNLLTSQRNAAYLASGAAFGSILLSGEIPPVVAGVAVVAFIASYVIGERTAGRGTVVWNVGIFGSLLYLGAMVFAGGLDIVLATSIFAMLVSLHRLFNRRTVRDYAYVHLTGLLMVAGGSALSAELAFGVCFVLFAVASTWSLTLTQLRQEIEDEAAQNKVADGGASVLADRRLVSPRLLGALGGLALAALLVAGLVFATFPRVSFGLWQRAQHQGPRTGFSDQVELGGHGRIKDDPRVAFRIRRLSSAEKPASLEMYWRGASFNTYDGRGWRDTTRPPLPVRMNMQRWYDLGEEGGALDEYEVSLGGEQTTNALFFTGRPVSLRILPQEGALRILEAARLLRDEQGDLVYTGGQTSETKYLLRTTKQPVEVAPRGLGREYEEQIRSHYLALPKLDPRIPKLAQELVAGKDPAEAAYAVEAHFRSFHYTMEMVAQGPDPLASFLFDVKAGHCEYFATAMAVLLRAGGIPTRLVTGFYGGRYVERGDYYAIREGDAHAWVEVYFPGKGWITFDPTPPQAREAMLQDFYGSFQLWLDGVRTAWRGAVVDYDLAAQMRGFKSLVEMVRDAGSRLSVPGPSGSFGDGWRRLAVAAGSAGLLAVGFVLARRARRPGTKELPRSEAQKRAGKLYSELLARLAKKGLKARATQTPREVAAEAKARGMPQAEAVSAIVERYLATKYGGAPLGEDELAALRRDVRRV